MAKRKKFVEKVSRVRGTTTGLRMKLSCEKRLGLMHDALVAAIIYIREERLPSCKDRKLLFVIYQGSLSGVGR